MAGAQFTGINMDEALERLKKAIDQYYKNLNN